MASFEHGPHRLLVQIASFADGSMWATFSHHRLYTLTFPTEESFSTTVRNGWMSQAYWHLFGKERQPGEGLDFPKGSVSFLLGRDGWTGDLIIFSPEWNDEEGCTVQGGTGMFKFEAELLPFMLEQLDRPVPRQRERN